MRLTGALRRHRLLTAALVIAALGILVAAVAFELLAARSGLLQGRAGVELAGRALAGAQPDTAQAAFADGQAAFAGAEARLSRPHVRLVAAVPAAGASLKTARALAAAGVLLSEAGHGLGEALLDLPGGLEALAPRDGALPLGPMRAMAQPLEDARALVADAEATVAEAPDRWLVGPVGSARDEFTAEVSAAVDGLTTAAALAAHLPSFLGADGPRRYFLGAQNPAELRGTGGLIGAYGILTVDAGRIDVGTFQTIGLLTEVAPESLPAPHEDFATRYGEFAATVHGSNVNMTPDMPSAAAAIETLYTAATGEALDGTILAAPQLLEALLQVIGPTEVAGVGEVRADRVVAFVTNEQYAALEAEEERKEVLGEVVGEVIRRFMEAGGARPQQALRALAGAVGDGHLLLHAADPEVQEAFATAGVDGALENPPGDFLAVIGNNSAANKLDYYTERRVLYEVRLQPDGSADAQATIELNNTAPSEGLHQEVIGPNVEDLASGQNRTWLSVYCATDCELQRAMSDDAPAGVSIQRELGHPVFSTLVNLPSGTSQRLTYTWVVPQAWERSGSRGLYRLTLRGQPTIPATNATVRVHPPPGLAITSDLGDTVTEGVATWSGQPGAETVVEVALARSLPASAGDFVRRTVNRPLLELATRDDG